MKAKVIENIPYCFDVQHGEYGGHKAGDLIEVSVGLAKKYLKHKLVEVVLND